MDEAEFSVQGIGYSSTISIVDNGGTVVVVASDSDFTLTLKDDPSDH